MLKRCPCCGGEAATTEITMLYNSPGDVKERITCTNCGLTIEDNFGLAKVKWNTRVENVTESSSEDDAPIQEGDLCTHY